nr:hypothetical protein Iba_chr03cCG2260 [Ipomoea batatas]
MDHDCNSSMTPASRALKSGHSVTRAHKWNKSHCRDSTRVTKYSTMTGVGFHMGPSCSDRSDHYTPGSFLCGGRSETQQQDETLREQPAIFRRVIGSSESLLLISVYECTVEKIFPAIVEGVLAVAWGSAWCFIWRSDVACGCGMGGCVSTVRRLLVTGSRCATAVAYDDDGGGLVAMNARDNTANMPNLL